MGGLCDICYNVASRQASYHANGQSPPAMAHSNLNHRRTHNLLLISKLLGQNVSPLTLILDTLEQPARPLLSEYLRRARLSKTHSILISFETFKEPHGAGVFVSCHDKSPLQITQAVSTAVAASPKPNSRCLILIDSLAVLATLSTKPSNKLNLTQYLSSFLQPPRQHAQIQLSMVAVYHTDVPIDTGSMPYSPSPLSLLSYLATTIVTVHSFPILLSAKAAQERSLAAPASGLDEEAEGIIVGLKPLARTLKMEEKGIVLELEHRRKSGRGVHEWYFLPDAAQSRSLSAQTFRETVILLDDHPRFRKQKPEEMSEEDLAGMTFELGLTDRQRQERESVVLPYFDAQKADGGGTGGGRILYDMGVEDDFDEEEDEI